MSLRPVAKEVKALVALLEQDWETPEVLAEELIKALDEARADRKTYMVVMQYGSKKLPWYVGLGPYAGVKSARQAAEKFPGATLARRMAVVPIMNQEGVAQLLKEVG